MKKWLYSLAFVVYGFLYSFSGFSAEKPWTFDLTGKIFVESRYFLSLDFKDSLNPITASNTKAATQLGGTFDTAFNIDEFQLLSRFNVTTDPLTNTKTYFDNGLAGGQKTDAATYGPTVTTNATAHPNAFFGNNAAGPWSMTVGSDGDANFMVRTLHLYWRPEIATFHIGRMPRHWGLGMHLHDGRNLHDRFMNVTDSFFVEKTWSDMWDTHTTVGVTMLDQGSTSPAPLESLPDDTRIYELTAEKTFDEASAGIYFAHQRRSDTGFRVQYVDLYTQLPFTAVVSEGERFDCLRNYTLGFEGLLNWGRAGIGTVDVRRWGVSLENSYVLNALHSLFLNGGIASGSTVREERKLETFAFNRNYNPMHTYILFDQGIGRLAGANVGTGLRADADIDVSTIFNALYVAGGWNWKAISDLLDLTFSMATAMTYRKFPNTIDEFYGAEADLDMDWAVAKNATLTNFLAFMYPGQLFDGGDVTGLDPAYAFGLQMAYVF